MIKRILLVILLLFFVSSSVYAVDFQFENKSDRALVYHLYWVSHNFKNHIFPVAMAVGELEPGKNRSVEQNYSSGVWEIQWRSIFYDYDGKVNLIKGMYIWPFINEVIIKCDGKKISIWMKKTERG